MLPSRWISTRCRSAGIRSGGFDAFQPRFGAGDVDVQRQERSFSGYFSVDTLTLRHRLHSGEWSDSMRRELFQRGDAVAVLPWDMATDELVLIEQLRVGAMRDNDSPWMLELIAGIVGGGRVRYQRGAPRSG